MGKPYIPCYWKSFIIGWRILTRSAEYKMPHNCYRYIHYRLSDLSRPDAQTPRGRRPSIVSQTPGVY